MKKRPYSNLSLALLCAAALAAHGTAQVTEGAKAPEFEIADARSTGLDDFKAFRGKVLMLDFFATW